MDKNTIVIILISIGVLVLFSVLGASKANKNGIEGFESGVKPELYAGKADKHDEEVNGRIEQGLKFLKSKKENKSNTPTEINIITIVFWFILFV